MPQNPLNALSAKIKGTSTFTPLLISPVDGGLIVSQDSAQSTSLGLSGAATLLKAGTGSLIRVSVTTAGSAAGRADDSATTGGVGVGTLIGTIPNTVGVYTFDFPYVSGLVITPGTGQTLSVSYS